MLLRYDRSFETEKMALQAKWDGRQVTKAANRSYAQSVLLSSNGVSHKSCLETTIKIALMNKTLIAILGLWISALVNSKLMSFIFLEQLYDTCLCLMTLLCSHCFPLSANAKSSVGYIHLESIGIILVSLFMFQVTLFECYVTVKDTANIIFLHGSKSPIQVEQWMVALLIVVLTMQIWVWIFTALFFDTPRILVFARETRNNTIKIFVGSMCIITPTLLSWHVYEVDRSLSIMVAVVLVVIELRCLVSEVFNVTGSKPNESLLKMIRKLIKTELKSQRYALNAHHIGWKVIVDVELERLVKKDELHDKWKQCNDLEQRLAMLEYVEKAAVRFSLADEAIPPAHLLPPL